MTMVTKIFSTPLGTLEYRVKGSGIPVVVIPPGIGRLERMLPLVDELSSQYRVITFNLLGVGKSSITHPTVTMIAQLIVEFLSFENIQNPILIGASYGGHIVLRLLSLIQAKQCILISTGEVFIYPI